MRRAWLCGLDPLTGRNYDHRRDWIVDRLTALSGCFAIDIYAYAVMSNHTHVVLYVDPDRITSLTDREIVQRWKTVWNWRDSQAPIIVEDRSFDPDSVNEMRERLCSISWFMKALKEPLARIANAEDECKGAFWESRFKSIPLLDEAAVLSCMTYVDLNPIKAGVCDTIEESEFTSIQRRVTESIGTDPEESLTEVNAASLKPVFSDACGKQVSLLPIAPGAYISLVRDTGESLLSQKSLLANSDLTRLALDPKGWMAMATAFLEHFRSAAGSYSAFESFMELTGRVRQQDRRGRKLLYLN